MATFSPHERIDLNCVRAEIGRPRLAWNGANEPDVLAHLLAAGEIGEIAPFYRVQLAHVIEICRSSRSLSEAGRALFAASRTWRASSNDADRWRKYLVRFSLEWSAVRAD